MPRSEFRLILDTNVILRGLVNIRSASGRIMDAADQNMAALLLNKQILAEYKAVLSDPEIIQKFPELTPEKVEIALRRFRYRGEYLRKVKSTFKYPRDPLDEKFIDLAIAGQATHLVTSDKDLLSLSSGHTDAAKWVRRRLPQLKILEPLSLINNDGRIIGIP
ncbi:MAG TPA: putative toxin-antitoxin system toxin component, PIN family [Tepidisphaeraceae bacterium]|jgi:putative PIN family toxin of toxin-antitoxin system|nr:putative toxin-antitoxin system toxin component, PIN family [Tepidisphaeraceae bacterium]